MTRANKFVVMIFAVAAASSIAAIIAYGSVTPTQQ